MTSEELIVLLDKYLGEIIENIIYKYNYNIDVEDEYDELLQYIARRLVRSWFKGRTPTPEEFEAALRSAARKRRLLEVLLSYLVSRYAARKGPVYMPRRSDWHDEHY